MERFVCSHIFIIHSDPHSFGWWIFCFFFGSASWIQQARRRYIIFITIKSRNGFTFNCNVNFDWMKWKRVYAVWPNHWWFTVTDNTIITNVLQKWTQSIGKKNVMWMCVYTQPEIKTLKAACVISNLYWFIHWLQSI